MVARVAAAATCWVQKLTTMVDEKDWRGTKSTIDHHLTYIHHLGW